MTEGCRHQDELSRRRAEALAGRSGNVRLLAAIFCPGCRLSLSHEVNSDSCPACGSALTSEEAVLPSSLEKCSPASGSVGVSTMLHTTDRADPRFKASDDVSVDDLIGRDFAQYRCEGLLGAGAMGRVYLARHLLLQRYCALKILPPSLAAQDQDFVRRFHNEGQAAAALNHPNIVAVHATGEAEGLYYLEMEFVPGLALRQLIEEEGPLAPERAVSMVLKIAEGLSLAHQHGILHRDLKPDNVLLTHQGIPKIGDFGLARRTHVEGNDGGPRDVVGTPQYMAPEVFRGEPATPAGDVYSLGVLFYQLLAGVLPYQGVTVVDLVMQVQQGTPRPIREVNPRVSLEIAEAVHQMMDPTPANRPPDGTAAARLLDAILGQETPLHELLTTAFARHPHVRWASEPGTDRYRVDLELLEGRRQTAYIEPSVDAAVDRLLTISSVCCRAVPDYYEAALRLNVEILHGGLAIRDIDGEAKFIMMDTYPRSTVDAEEIRRSVLEVAHRADAIEKLLTNQDQY